jgi:hypothetical protein
LYEDLLLIEKRLRNYYLYNTMEGGNSHLLSPSGLGEMTYPVMSPDREEDFAYPSQLFLVLIAWVKDQSPYPVLGGGKRWSRPEVKPNVVLGGAAQKEVVVVFRCHVADSACWVGHCVG